MDGDEESWNNMKKIWAGGQIETWQDDWVPSLACVFLHINSDDYLNCVNATATRTKENISSKIKTIKIKV